MNCPNCNSKINDKNICVQCGVDTIVFENVMKISNRLYNQGLKNIKNNDITGAINCLTKSIEFNKNNCNARNLLGLIYFEIGHIGNALKQFVISSSILKKDNPAKGYLEAIQKDDKARETMNNSIIAYNKALRVVKIKNEDMAIIQLKKILKSNDNFIDAMNLLALCYLLQNNKSSAKKYIELVLQKDISNEKALLYYKEVYDTKATETKHIKVEKEKPPMKNKEFRNRLMLANSIALAIGLSFGFVISYGFVMPSRVNSLNRQITQLEETSQAQLEVYNTTNQENKAIIEQYREENASLQVRADSFDRIILIDQKLEDLSELERLSTTGNFAEVSEALITQDFSILSPTDIARVEVLKNNNLPRMTGQLHGQAVTLFRAEEFEAAKEVFDIAYMYALETDPLTRDILLHQGRIEEINSNFEGAKLYYHEVVDRFPNTAQATEARNRLNNLE
jgi:tetratricopeptide (TPR) repeat protein